ncbi:MAG: YifB family Mg chelatase-like AAA ATPase [Lachnospiraceae bacterium]|nr:YifB family Mg chelatase-like AAA ATPase [Lachnospiraceae bacterium]
MQSKDSIRRSPGIIPQLYVYDVTNVHRKERTFLFGKVLSADVRGIEGFGVSVEADISDGMPMFLMVGYLASEVREAGDRVRTALKNCGVVLPAKRITVNLAPASVRKAGSRFDLPIAAALLAALGLLEARDLSKVLVAGELSLNGEIHGISGILPMVESARDLGCSSCVVPLANMREASLVSGIQVWGIRHLKELLPEPESGFSGRGRREMEKSEGSESGWNKEGLFDRARQEERLFSRLCRGEGAREEDRLLEDPDYEVDFSEIHGQESLKRASQVAVAGMHNFLMIGPPGSGKTMVARRIPTILPPLRVEESLELSKIYSIAGLLSGSDPLIRQRPFRAPHHTITPAALTGGGRIPMPGEISLGTHGVLFLDELPEFQKTALEILRQPLEEGEVRICRSYGTYVYPARFMLVGAMNPCRCGYYPDRNLCRCGTEEVRRYLGRLSQPLLDRMDICMEAPRLSYEELTSRAPAETSAEIRSRMKRVHALQRERYEGTPWRFNSDLNGAGLEEFCPLGKKEQKLLKDAFERLHLSARAYHRIIKVARTIADLEEAKQIGCGHLLEAVCYRTMDKKFGIG